MSSWWRMGEIAICLEGICWTFSLRDWCPLLIKVFAYNVPVRILKLLDVIAKMVQHEGWHCRSVNHSVILFIDHIIYGLWWHLPVKLFFREMSWFLEFGRLLNSEKSCPAFLTCWGEGRISVLIIYLKGRYTIGNCERPVFSVGVSQSIHNINKKQWKFELNWSSKLGENDERKNTLVGRIFLLSDRKQKTSS